MTEKTLDDKISYILQSEDLTETDRIFLHIDIKNLVEEEVKRALGQKA